MSDWVEAVVAGARKASVHALRAAGEAVSAITAFVDEVSRVLREGDDRPEHVEVEGDE